MMHGTQVADASLEIRNPHDGSLIGSVPVPGDDEVEATLAAAAAGAPAVAALTSAERSELLYGASERLGTAVEELARTISLEAGKPIRDARAEASRAQYVFRWAAEETKRLDGEWIALDTEPGLGRRGGLIRHFPVGPLLAIAPFNFPLNLVAHKVAPALAAGNPVVIKPSTRTPLSAQALLDVIAPGDWPAGALGILPIGGAATATAAADPRIAAISFTGSDRVGWGLKEANPKKRVTLELGGNAAAIVEPGCDLDWAVARLVFGAFSYAGQVCLSTQRILVHEEIHDEFVERYLAGVDALVAGDPSKEDTDLGPMISEAEAIRVEEWVAEAVALGARALRRGERDGAFLAPSVLAEVPERAHCWRDEIFGPVVNIDSYGDFDEALRLANATRYGLQAAVFTPDVEKALRAHQTIEAGAVVLNDAPFFRAVHMPYGGVGDSGFGREGVSHAMREMLEPRLLVMTLPEPG